MVWRLYFSYPPDFAGPYDVSTLRLDLNSSPKGRIWPHPRIQAVAWAPTAVLFPSEEGRDGIATGQHTKTQLWPLVIYAPGWGGKFDDNSVTAHNLASNGYVVLAIDDILHDAPFRSPEDETARLAPIRYDTQEAQGQFIKTAERRVILEADKVSRLIDALNDCAGGCEHSGWIQKVDCRHVGILGNSFGGAVAAQLAATDERVAAVVNMDGWQYGSAALSPVNRPYMVFNSAESDPQSDPFRYSSSGRAFTAQMNAAHQQMQMRQAERPDAMIVTVRGAIHSDFSNALDNAFTRLRQWRPWWGIPASPHHIRSIIGACIQAFFEAHLLGERQALEDLIRSPPSGAKFARINRDES